jgi:hypothetical protein
MAQDYAGADRREANLKNRSKRRRHWTKRKWRTSAAGNAYLNVDGFNIVVFRQGNAFSARIEHRASERQWFLKQSCETEKAAALAAFDAMFGIKKQIDEELLRELEEVE